MGLHIGKSIKKAARKIGKVGSTSIGAVAGAIVAGHTGAIVGGVLGYNAAKSKHHHHCQGAKGASVFNNGGCCGTRMPQAPMQFSQQPMIAGTKDLWPFQPEPYQNRSKNWI